LARATIVARVLRSLVISDLHLGGRLGHGVLMRPEPLRRLLRAIDGFDRLVLLGDTIELLEGRPQQAMAMAEPIVRAFGERLGPDREALVIPGNHDRALIRGWIRAQGPSLTVDTIVPHDASPALERLVSWLAPARVTVRYPGAWLSDGVWAMHGHYLDRHLLPVSAYGVSRDLFRRSSRSRAASPVEYEHARRPSLARTARWMPQPMATLVDEAAELLRAATMPRRRMFNRRMAPVTATVLGAQMRRAAIPAVAQVVDRLGIDADWVVFGHVHRLGPLDGDDVSQWRGPGGRPRIVCSGSWQYEPLLVHRASPQHPYWPGGAVVVEPGMDPRAIGLLDDVAEELLRGAA
jgi:UDP-2,3-diacylglucosamine pyrophosphatase LpxH